MRARCGASRFCATTPRPHPLRRRSRSPRSRFLPFFFCRQTLAGPRSIGRGIVKIYAHDWHPRLINKFIVPRWTAMTLPPRFLTKLFVLFICDFELVDIEVWQVHLVRGLLVGIVSVVPH